VVAPAARTPGADRSGVAVPAQRAPTPAGALRRRERTSGAGGGARQRSTPRVSTAPQSRDVSGHRERCKQRRGCPPQREYLTNRFRVVKFDCFARCARSARIAPRNPPTWSSLGDEKHVPSLLLSTAGGAIRFDCFPLLCRNSRTRSFLMRSTRCNVCIASATHVERAASGIAPRRVVGVCPILLSTPVAARDPSLVASLSTAETHVHVLF
jgi:hypothetical protein